MHKTAKMFDGSQPLYLDWADMALWGEGYRLV